jgi:hypothetical protein
LTDLSFPSAAPHIALQEYRDAIAETEQRIDRLTEQLRQLVPTWRWAAVSLPLHTPVARHQLEWWARLVGALQVPPHKHYANFPPQKARGTASCGRDFVDPATGQSLGVGRSLTLS